MVMYNVSNELVEKAISITPGKRSPTVTSLDDNQSKAVSSLVLKKDSSTKMDELHDLGCTDILVLSLSNTRM
jgi:ATP phosphoribosyltransferase